MAKKSNYTINYQSIGVGNHSFEFDLSTKFFKNRESSDITDGRGRVVIEAEKSNNSLVLEVLIDAEVEVTCDRCLETFFLPISYEGVIHIKFSDSVESGLVESFDCNLDDDVEHEVMWQNRADSDIDMSNYVYESIFLNLPYQRVHPADSSGVLMCNEEMLSRFSHDNVDDEY